MAKLFDQFPLELKKEVIEFRQSNSKPRSRKKPSNSTKLKVQKPKISINFAYPSVKKLPLDTKRQVISAMNDFDKVKGITDTDKKSAYEKILNSAKQYSICTMGLSSKFEHCLFKSGSEESKK